MNISSNRPKITFGRTVLTPIPPDEKYSGTWTVEAETYKNDGQDDLVLLRVPIVKSKRIFPHWQNVSQKYRELPLGTSQAVTRMYHQRHLNINWVQAVYKDMLKDLDTSNGGDRRAIAYFNHYKPAFEQALTQTSKHSLILKDRIMQMVKLLGHTTITAANGQP